MKTQPCPTCKRPAAWKRNPWRPFCSERCKLIDLGLWATERHRIPGEQVQSEGTSDEEESHPHDRGEGKKEPA